MPGRPTSTPIPPRIFLMIFCSKVSSSSSWACCADAASGSTKSAPIAQPIIRSRRKLSPGSRSRMAIIRPAGSTPRYSATFAAPLDANSTQSSRGIGALLRRCPPRVFIQESRHPGNDGGIRQIEYVPDEIERFRGDMEKHEIGHRPISDPIDGVSERSPDDQAKGEGRQPEFRPGEPD